MGLFGNLFGSSVGKEDQQLPWIPLTSLDQLEEIQEKSKLRTQFIFKHSTSCGISRMVFGMFTRKYGLAKEDADLYYLDLHAHRDVSNEVAAVFQVMHQSPQLLVIKNGTTVFHTSHGAISEAELEQFI